MKKLEDRCGQVGREKEELRQALTALKKGQSIAAGPGQTRTVNLMRRVHTLVIHPRLQRSHPELAAGSMCMHASACACETARPVPQGDSS